ncbi:MAG: DoxX family membrane protein [Chlamydiia bacterium]|nr:DoxX family membrane protein [Chlamydiia bacterium]
MRSMRLVRNFTEAIARFLLSAIFLVTSINKMFHWDDFERILGSIFNDWLTYGILPDSLQDAFLSLAHWAPALLIVSTAFEFFGALLILLGWNERLGATLLILLLIPTTFLFHPFWLLEGTERELATPMFLKNLSIIGALIFIALNGTRSRERAVAFSP